MTARAAVSCSVLFLALWHSPAFGQPKRPPPDPYAKALAGGYDLSTADGARRCLILLRPEEGGRRAVGFPPPCRRSLPVLAEVAGWRAETGGDVATLRIVLTSASGADRLVFPVNGDADVLVADDGAAGGYRLKPMAGPSVAARAGVAATVKAEQDRARLPVPATDRVAMGQLAGTYRLVRSGGRDTGCAIDLLPAKEQAGEARLHDGCADRGVMVFSPGQWRIAAGTLWLLSARGKLSFERDRKGQWHKGPGQGEALTLARP